jgi:hypothetical protein
MGIEKSSVENLSKEPEKQLQEESNKASPYDLAAEPARQERRKGHQLVSTETYYRTERRGISGYSYGEPQDWMDGDIEIDGGPYLGPNF